MGRSVFFISLGLFLSLIVRTPSPALLVSFSFFLAVELGGNCYGDDSEYEFDGEDIPSLLLLLVIDTIVFL